jgi:polysaccharide pyruvyl transferase CsaB
VLAGLLAGWRAREPDAPIVVLSGDPAATRALHGVDARPRGPLAVWRALAGARGLVSGGGSLVQDVTSARSALYYLGTMWAAQHRGVPVAVLGQGIGPVRRPWLRAMARRLYRRAAIVSIRDGDSVAALAAMGVTRPVHRGADLAFLATPAPQAGVRGLLAGAGLDAASPRIGLVVRDWPGLLAPGSLGAVVGQFAREMSVAVAVLPFDLRRDAVASAAASEAAGGRVVTASTPEQLMALVGAMDLVVAARLHALIFATAVAVPAVGIAYDPKVTAFATEARLPAPLPVDTAADAIRRALAQAWEARAEARRRLEDTAPALRHRAAEAVAMVVEALTPAARGIT